jgi:AGCS family alanine or glycine:cation symporter
VGNATQINAVISGVNGVLCRFGGGETPTGNLIMGIFLALLVGAMLLGGAKRIGQTAERLVPAVSAGYILLCVGVLLLRLDRVPGAFRLIFEGALSPRAATGGILGSAFQALRVGCSRGVFTNEAGMGTAAIAHGSAEVNHPAEQGMMGILEVFLDTILICTLTALVILCSGVDINYGVDTGVLLTVDAFSEVLGAWVCVPIAVAMCCFAVATVLGWGLYGIRCAQYLFGEKAWRPFVYLQGAVVLISSVLQTGTVWILAETVNGLMAIPNLIALAYLAPELHRLVGAFTPATKNLGIKKQAF